MKKIIISAALAAAMFPAAVDAKPGHGHGGQSGHGQTTAALDQYTPEPPATPVPPRSRRCRHTQSVGFAARGTLTAFDADTITLDVRKANKHARSYIRAAGSQFTLGGARVKFEGVTDDAGGTVDFADVLSTDRVKVTGKASRPKRGCTGDAVLKLRKVQVVRETADDSDDSDDS